MNEARRNSIRWWSLGLVAMVLVAVSARPARATVGDVIQTLSIPAAAQCGGQSGTAVAVVPGGKVGFPKIPTLLVTSCVQAGQAKLFFLDPSRNPTELVKTLNTTVTPTAGWESLAVRPDQVDLIGCGMVEDVLGVVPKVYSIDYSSIPPNTTIDGTATFLFSGPAG